MTRKRIVLSLSSLAASFSVAVAATPGDQAFVAKVSQGGMFEVQAGQLAEQKGGAQDVRDFGAMEVHDHMRVGDKLKSTVNAIGITFTGALDPKFSSKLEHLKSLSGPAFDEAYMQEMSTLHAGDGAAFAEVAQTGETPALRAFGAETHKIVQRHIGAIHAVAPPAR